MGSKLYVGNLSYSTSEDTLRAAFEEGGRRVRNVSIIMDRDTGRSRGFGFVQMASEEDARAAMDALDGLELDGRPLRVKEAREREGGRRGERGEGRPPAAQRRGARDRPPREPAEPQEPRGGGVIEPEQFGGRGDDFEGRSKGARGRGRGSHRNRRGKDTDRERDRDFDRPRGRSRGRDRDWRRDWDL